MDTSQIAFAAMPSPPSSPGTAHSGESRFDDTGTQGGFADTYDASRENGGADRETRVSDGAGVSEPLVSAASLPKESQRSNQTFDDAGTGAGSGREMTRTRGSVEVTDAGVTADTPTSGEEQPFPKVSPLEGAGLVPHLPPGTQGTAASSPQDRAGRQGMPHVTAGRIGDGSDRVTGPAVMPRTNSKEGIEPGAPLPERKVTGKTEAPETATARRAAASVPGSDEIGIATRGSAATESPGERVLPSAAPPAKGPAKGTTEAARPTPNAQAVPSAGHPGSIPDALGTATEPAAGKDRAGHDAPPAVAPPSTTTHKNVPHIGSSNRDAVTPSSGAHRDATGTLSRPDTDGQSSPTERTLSSDRPSSAGVATDPAKVMPNAAAFATESMPAQVSAEGAVDPVSGDIAAPDVSRADRTISSTMTTTAITRPDTAQSVAGQIADVVRTGGDGKIEVTLRPEELGRLSLTLSNDGRAMHVTLAADRPETLDLVRRNIDLLERELLDLGFDTLNFDFSDPPGGRPGQDVPGTKPHEPGTMAQVTDDTPPVPHPTTAGQTAGASSGGVDLRL